MKQSFPDFLVVGTAKAGTSSLHRYLKEHPEIALPKTKETLFWHIITNSNKVQLQYLPKAITNLEDYLVEFSNVRLNQICGEVCPSYLYFYKHTINNVYKLHPTPKKLKILIILRNPVDKVISHYNFLAYKLKATQETLDEAIKSEVEKLKNADHYLVDHFIIDSTKYYEQVKAFKEAFPDTKVFFYDDFKKNQEKFLRSIYDFLEVEPGYKPANLNEKYNLTPPKIVQKSSLSARALVVLKKNLPGSIKEWIPYEIKKTLFKTTYQEVVPTYSEQIKQEIHALFLEDMQKLKSILNESEVKYLENWGY